MQRKFKNIFINYSYQLKYLLLIAGSGFMVSMIHTVVYWKVSNDSMELVTTLVPNLDDMVRERLNSQIQSVISYLVISSVIFTLMLTAISVIVTHRTVGPLYRFKKAFVDVKNGIFTVRMNLRDKDELQDVAQDFNQMMDYLEKNKAKDC